MALLKSSPMVGMIDRRLLVNYRVDPEVLSRQLPAQFRPQVVDGHAVAGICLIRMSQLRPRHFPAWIGLTAENAAHRAAVEWSEPDGSTGHGVWIPHRDTDSRIIAAAGGRLYPGPHGLAHFDVDDTGDRIRLAFRSTDGERSVRVRLRATGSLGGELFTDLAAASDFFERGSVGRSPSGGEGLDTIELRTDAWHVEPVEIDEVHSSFFDDSQRFPKGSAVADHALLMRRIPVEWVPAGHRQRVSRMTGSVSDTSK